MDIDLIVERTKYAFKNAYSIKGKHTAKGLRVIKEGEISEYCPKIIIGMNNLPENIETCTGKEIGLSINPWGYLSKNNNWDVKVCYFKDNDKEQFISVNTIIELSENEEALKIFNEICSDIYSTIKAETEAIPNK